MFISYILELYFIEKPNYKYLYGLIDRLFTKFGFFKDDIKWFNEEFLKKLYDLVQEIIIILLKIILIIKIIIIMIKIIIKIIIIIIKRKNLE